MKDNMTTGGAFSATGQPTETLVVWEHKVLDGGGAMRGPRGSRSCLSEEGDMRACCQLKVKFGTKSDAGASIRELRGARHGRQAR